MAISSALILKFRAVLDWLVGHAAILIKPLVLLNQRTIMRWRYPEDKLRSLISLRVSGDTEGLIVYANPHACAIRAYVLVANFTPFPLIIDRVVGQFRIGGTRVHLPQLARLSVPAKGHATLYLEAELTQAHIDKIEAELAHIGDVDCGIDAAEIVIDTPIGRRIGIRRDLNAANRRFVNFKNTARARS